MRFSINRCYYKEIEMTVHTRVNRSDNIESDDLRFHFNHNYNKEIEMMMHYPSDGIERWCTKEICHKIQLMDYIFTRKERPPS